MQLNNSLDLAVHSGLSDVGIYISKYKCALSKFIFMLSRSEPHQLVSLPQLQCWLYNANISLLTNALCHIQDLLLPCGVFQVPAFTHPRSIATFRLY